MPAGRETYRRRRIDEEEQENAGGGLSAMNAAPGRAAALGRLEVVVIGLCVCSRSTSVVPLRPSLAELLHAADRAKAAEFTLGNYTSA